MAALALLVLTGSASAAPQFRPDCFFSLCGQLSDDGQRVVFPFQDVFSENIDGHPKQIFEWSGGTLHPLVEFPPQDPNNVTSVEMKGMSRDGGTVFVHSSHTLNGSGGPGLFEIEGGETRRLTPFADPPADFDFGTPYVGNSPSGDRVILRDASSGSCGALWELTGTGISRLAEPDSWRAPFQVDGTCLDPYFGGISGDESHLFFTREGIIDIYFDGKKIGENPGCSEIYAIAGGTTTKLTDFEPVTPPKDCYAYRFGDSSNDGGSILFSTDAPLVTADTDSFVDMYVRTPDGTPRLLSPGPRNPVLAPIDEYNSQIPLALASDGRRAVFLTDRQLSPLDLDQAQDIYATSLGEPPELISTGVADTAVEGRIPPPEAVSQRQVDVSDDARTVAFETDQRLVAEDQDDAVDVYVNANGSTTLASLTPFGGNGANKARLVGLSGDGRSLAYLTRERMTEFDIDGGETDYFLRTPQGGSSTAAKRSSVPAGPERTILVSEETTAPRMKLRPRLGRRGKSKVALKITCPPVEVNGPCEGRVGIGGGKKRFRMASGKSRLLTFRVKRPGRHRFVAKGMARDRVGNEWRIQVKVRRRGANRTARPPLGVNQASGTSSVPGSPVGASPASSR